MTIQTKYDIGQIVYLKTDTNQLPRMIVSIQRNNNETLYMLAQSTSTSWHFEIEISEEKDVLLLCTA